MCYKTILLVSLEAPERPFVAEETPQGVVSYRKRRLEKVL
jgi:hypothetical protein